MVSGVGGTRGRAGGFRCPERTAFQKARALALFAAVFAGERALPPFRLTVE